MSRWRRLYRQAEPRRGWLTAAVLLAVYAGPAFGVAFFCKDSSGDAAFYPANGVIVAGLLVLPRRIGLAFSAACLGLNLVQNAIAGIGLNDSLLYTALNQGLSFAVALLTRRFCGAATDLSRSRRLTVFAAIAVGCAAVEGTIGQLAAAFVVDHSTDHFVSQWLQWIVQDGLGVVIATPAILLPLKSGRAAYASDATRAERWLLFAVTMAVAILGFSQDRSLVALLVFPLLILTAFRAGPPWVSASVMGAAFVVCASTAHGHGPIAVLGGGDSERALEMTQAVLIATFLCAAPASNALAERNRIALRLSRMRAAAQTARISAEAANHAKSQFVANMTHEIRTPLNGVLGMTQAMASGELSPLQRERLDVIRKSGDMLLAILNDVLDLSKIEAGKLALEAAPFDVIDLVRGAHAAFSAISHEKDLAFVLEVDPDAAGVYRGDSTRVRQIIYNLVSNALKFTETGEVRMRVAATDTGLAIRVSDTGIGIAPERLGRLFRKFEQADASTTRRFGGTGLGLAICRELAQLMGGSIAVESVVGQGSTFTVVLPLERLAAVSRSQARAAPPDPGATPAAGFAERPLRILAAEDNPVNQLVLKTLLHQADLHPVLVDDGRAAVVAWEAQDWDLILMDMQMPVMDGLAATQAIRARETATGRTRTPIIALTANVMAHQVSGYLEAGMDTFVAKPIDAAQLFAAIADVVAAPAQGDALSAVAG